MPKPPRTKDRRSANENGCDFEQASRILSAMNFLRKEAVRTHIPEIITMIDETFRIVVTTYHCIIRSDKMPVIEKLKIPAAQPCDFAQAEQVLSALNFLRKQAEKAGIDEITAIIDATFKIVVTAHYCVLRNEMTKLPATEH